VALRLARPTGALFGPQLVLCPVCIGDLAPAVTAGGYASVDPGAGLGLVVELPPSWCGVGTAFPCFDDPPFRPAAQMYVEPRDAPSTVPPRPDQLSVIHAQRIRTYVRDPLDVCGVDHCRHFSTVGAGRARLLRAGAPGSP
jgi:hypothetical protein